MNALARIQAAGLRIRIGPAGRLQVAPAAKLSTGMRQLIAEHADELRAGEGVHRAWRVTLANGTRLVSVRPEGCTQSEMLTIVRQQFGAERVLDVTRS